MESQDENDSDFVQDLKFEMLSDFETRFGTRNCPYWRAEGRNSMERQFMNRQVGIHRVFLIASVLDPRWKNFVLIEGFDVDVDSKNKIQREILKLMIEVSAEVDGEMSDSESSSEEDTDSDESDDATVSSLEKLRQQRRKAMRAANLNEGNSREKCKSEWKDYKTVVDLPANSCPLMWWKSNASRFPCLSVLARRFLAVQATSAPSERIFSQAQLIISSKRTSLNPEMAGKLFYVGQNIDWYEKQIAKK